jgi:hypothetical protein
LCAVKELYQNALVSVILSTKTSSFYCGLLVFEYGIDHKLITGTDIWCWTWYRFCLTAKRITRLNRKKLKAPPWTSLLSSKTILRVYFLRYYFLWHQGFFNDNYALCLWTMLCCCWVRKFIVCLWCEELFDFVTNVDVYFDI